MQGLLYFAFTGGHYNYNMDVIYCRPPVVLAVRLITRPQHSSADLSIELCPVHLLFYAVLYLHPVVISFFEHFPFHNVSTTTNFAAAYVSLKISVRQRASRKL